MRQPRRIHEAWDGLILRYDDPWWQTHYPPGGYGCKCFVETLSERDMQKLGKDGPDKAPEDGEYEWQAPDGAIHKIPVGVDPGWDYVPGASVMEVVKQKLITLDSSIGANMWDELKVWRVEEQNKAFATFVEKVLANKPNGQAIIIGALDPEWVNAASRHHVIPATADITIRDADVWHTFRDSKKSKLDVDWYKNLPALLSNPDCVILDTSHNDPAFLLIFTDSKTSKKIVIRINYQIKKLGIGNIVETGKEIQLSDIRAKIGHGYEIIEGDL